MPYDEFYIETSYRQFTRALPVIAVLMAGSALGIFFTPPAYYLLPIIFCSNGLAMLAVGAVIFMFVRRSRRCAVKGAILLGYIFLADILVCENLTCSILHIPFSPVYVVGYLALIMLSMHQQSNPDARARRHSTIMLLFLFALVSSAFEFVNIIPPSLHKPLWWLVIVKIILSFFPPILVSVVHTLAVERYREQLAETTRANEKLMSSMRYIICGETFGALIHDVRNVINDVYWAMERIMERFSKDTVALPISNVMNALERSSKMSEQFIGYLKMDPTAVTQVNVQAVLASVIAFVQSSNKASKGIRFISHDTPLDPALARVRASEYRLFSVLLNIIINAMQSLQASPKDDKIIETGIRTENGSITIEISDNGPGIAPEILPRIFEVFTTKPDGGGLGLYFARKYIHDDLHGMLDVKSIQNEKTTFTISLAATGGKNHGPDRCTPTPERNAA